MGFDSPTDNPYVQLAFEGFQRLCQSKTTKKESITSETIKSLVNKFGGKMQAYQIYDFCLNVC